MTDYTPNPARAANEDEGATTNHKGFNYRATLHYGLFDRGHHTLQNQRRRVSGTQNVEKLFTEISDDSDSDLDAPLDSETPLSHEAQPIAGGFKRTLGGRPDPQMGYVRIPREVE